jgi:predicted dehydrogenase
MNIGIIGKGNQARKIVNILNEKKFKLIHYHYKKSTNFTNKISDLNNCDCIFILSPTFSHHKYLKKLNKYKGYIFLEKPGASNVKEINFLKKKLNEKKLYINYNYIFSDYYKKIKNSLNKEFFGSLLRYQITQTNGVALKDNYDNWRFIKSKCKGIEEINTVHFIHLILSLFRKIKITKKHIVNISKKNNDNAYYSFLIENKIVIEIFNSYTSPVVNNFSLIFVNAIINYNGKYISIYYPWNSSSKNGRLIEPKIKQNIKLDFSSDWNKSTKKSVKYFIKHVQKKTYFEEKEYSKYIETLNFVFKKKFNKV